MKFENFDLLISDPPEAQVLSAPGLVGSEAMPLDLDVTGLTERAERLAGRANPPEEELKALGGALFQALMQGEILALFYQSLGVVRNSGHGLRLRLHLETASLASLPWELIYTRREDFLSTNTSFSICRYRPVAQPVPRFSLELPLRVLVVVSAPADLPPLSVDVEIGALEQALGAMRESRGVELTYQQDAQREAILGSLQRETVHVLHFIGHGTWEEGRGLVCLTDSRGLLDGVDAEKFGEMLADSSTLRLVVLNACSTAYEGTGRGFAGVASQLVERGVPAVIAMRKAVQDQAAITFARHLYGNLAGGEAVDAAMTRARQQLRLERGANPGAFGLPILYLHAPDGGLFEVVDARQRRLVRVAQQVVSLNETGAALAEWKELHEILHLLYNALSLVYQMARNPQGASLLPDVWASFRGNLDGKLLPFAMQSARFVGKRYQEVEGVRTGEEWALRGVEIANQIDQAITDNSQALMVDALVQMRSLLTKHLSLCNARMIELVDRVSAAYNETRDMLQALNRAEAGATSAGLNWNAILEDLRVLDGHNGRIAEWMRLHDLFDRLHLQFATIVANAAAAGTLELLAQSWQGLRDSLLAELLDQAQRIALIGRAYSQQEDGSLYGEPWVIEIKLKSDQLDAAIAARSLERTGQVIKEMDRLIQKNYLQINRGVREEMRFFTERSIELKGMFTL